MERVWPKSRDTSAPAIHTKLGGTGEPVERTKKPRSASRYRLSWGTIGISKSFGLRSYLPQFAFDRGRTGVKQKVSGTFATPENFKTIGLTFLAIRGIEAFLQMKSAISCTGIRLYTKASRHCSATPTDDANAYSQYKRMVFYTFERDASLRDSLI